MERRTVLMGMGAGAVATAAGAISQAAVAAESKAAFPDKGKIAVISGISSGIGQATALALADRGVHVIGSFRNNQPGALQTVAEAKKRGTKIVPFHLDLNYVDSIHKFRDNVVATLQSEWKTDRFDYLVNNAGFARTAMFTDTTEALFDEFIRVDLKGHFFMTQDLLPIIKDGGAIVNVTSSSTLPTSISPGFSGYATAKGGLVTLTRYMAKEFAPRKIRVNSVSPGPTRTRLNNDGFAKHPEAIPPLAAITALKRIGEPADLGRAIVSLLSDEMGWVTGENIEVSGGFNM
jgi:NAD(P)-dependent dehydrogenase (short-subunit alcohol dehydrogenase family)